MGGFLGFLVALLYLLGKIFGFLLLLSIKASISLCRNTSQYLRSRWKDVCFCFILSIFLAHWMEKSRDWIYLLIHICIFSISLFFTRSMLVFWRMHQKRIKVLIRYAFRKKPFAKWYIYSKDHPDL